MNSTFPCDAVVQKYLNTLSADFAVTPSENGCYVLTPFLRPDGEAIELEIVSLPNGAASLDDMGDTLGYLYANGLALTKSVLDKAQRIARRHQVALRQNSLAIESESGLTGGEIHRLMQASMEISNLIQGRRSAGRVVFDTEVESFVIQSGVVYDVDFKVPGQLESHTYKFHINSGRNMLIQPITAATEATAHSWAERWAYRFGDTIANTAGWQPVAVLDDRGNRQGIWTPRARAPLRDWSILWADRERLTGMLVH